MTRLPPAVVVPLDGSELAESALPVAVALADMIDGRLVLVSVLAQPAELLGYLDEVAHISGRADHPAEVLVDADLLEFLLDDDPERDVIVCRTSGLYRRDAFTRSSAVRTLARTNRPVVKVGPMAIAEDWFAVERIVIPTDGSEFAAGAMRLAAQWSDLLDVPITIFHVADPDRGNELVPDCLDSVLNRHPVLATRRRRTSFIEAVHGDPALRILDEAGSGALIVMATHARIGSDRLVYGSITEQVLRYARRPVLTIRSQDAPDPETGAEHVGVS